MRPTWDETWMAVADAVSKRSDCCRAQHGAVIVDPDNRIIATGYNGPPRGFIRELTGCDRYCSRARTGEYVADYSNCVSVHAESNAVAFADRERMEGGTLYINGLCCYTCAKLVSNSGVVRVVLRVNPEQGYRISEPVWQMFYDCGIKVTEMTIDE